MDAPLRARLHLVIAMSLRYRSEIKCMCSILYCYIKCLRLRMRHHWGITLWAIEERCHCDSGVAVAVAVCKWALTPLEKEKLPNIRHRRHIVLAPPPPVYHWLPLGSGTLILPLKRPLFKSMLGCIPSALVDRNPLPPAQIDKINTAENIAFLGMTYCCVNNKLTDFYLWRI